MPLTPEDRAFFRSTLPASEIFDASSSDFQLHTMPWSLSYDKSPQLALAPSTVSTLQQIVKYLYEHEAIDFTARGRGVGSTSAHDVILSMRNFTNIEFNEGEKTADIGSGLNWGEVDARLDEIVSKIVPLKHLMIICISSSGKRICR